MILVLKKGFLISSGVSLLITWGIGFRNLLGSSRPYFLKVSLIQGCRKIESLGRTLDSTLICGIVSCYIRIIPLNVL